MKPHYISHVDPIPEQYTIRSTAHSGIVEIREPARKQMCPGIGVGQRAGGQDMGGTSGSDIEAVCESKAH